MNITKILDLDSNICVAILKYTNPNNNKKHELIGNDIKGKNTSIDENCLHI
jgi:hypothetical protein